jgi:hypothetical protein
MSVKGRERKFIFENPPTLAFPTSAPDHHIFEQDDAQAGGLIKELSDTVQNSRYSFSPRIRVLRKILTKLRPEPDTGAATPPRHYAPPRATRARRRRG